MGYRRRTEMLIFDQFPSTASANLFAMTAQRMKSGALRRHICGNLMVRLAVLGVDYIGRKENKKTIVSPGKLQRMRLPT
jgi:hypothetical protein